MRRYFNLHFVFLSLSIFLSSCNVYKSAGRKNLESLGPPPGSIKTSSKAQVLFLNPNENFIPNSSFFQICRLSENEGRTCSENLVCMRASVEEKSSPSQMAMLDIDSNLLLDQNDPKMIFDFALVCKRM